MATNRWQTPLLSLEADLAKQKREERVLDGLERKPWQSVTFLYEYI